jgi:phage tail sheath protein FI
VAALAAGLAAAEPEDAVDLVCAPDIVRPAPGETRVYPDDVAAMQRQVLEACDRTDDRFAILDPLPAADVGGVLAQRDTLSGRNGALYYPWIRSGDRLVPPCGHVAGVYALTDGQAGVHKAPANVALEDALDAVPGLDAADQARLNPEGVNAIRVFPGRGIRVWGARTLSREPEWIYVNVRRTFVTLGRWIALNLAGLAFEPNDPLLWARINRALSGHLVELWQAGALRGATADEAFYVKCDAETNPDEVRAAGRVVTEVGLAPSVPNEFVTVRVVLGDGAAAVGQDGATSL